MRKILLQCGAGAAVLYFATLIVASLTWPGYSHVTQYASELGTTAAPNPWIFNYGILATGVLGALGGLGVGVHFATANRPYSGILAGLSLAAWGVGMVFGSLHPLPDPLHNGYGLVMGAALLPIFLMLALRGVAGRRVFTLLMLWQVAMVAFLAITFGVGDLVTTKNIGLWQRGVALAMIPGLGIACGYLSRR